MKINRVISLLLVSTVLLQTTVYANVGDLGFFTGITSGRRLPKTTETLNDIVDNSNVTFDYKELVYLGEEPTVFEGTINIANSLDMEKAEYSTEIINGTGSANYTVKPYKNGPKDAPASINRNINFDVNYYSIGDSTVKDYSMKSWKESITVGEQTYTLDSSRSHYQLSISEQNKPSVTYYAGDLSSYAYYTLDEDVITVEQVGRIYGYTSAYSQTETHRIDVTVKKGDKVFQYQVRPSVTSQKDLIWNDNEPTLMSFSGNYREIMSNVSGLTYDVTNKPNSAYLLENKGSVSLETPNTFEQLIPIEINSLKGHWAYSDIQKLYSLRVLEGNPEFFVPNQAITRSDFVEMLVNTIKLEVEENPTPKNTVSFLFPDVTSQRDDYNVIMTAYKNGLIYGQEHTAQFYPDEIITREEALSIIMRSLGLDNIGYANTNITPFVDDANISDYAKKYVYTAHKIGLITPNSQGEFNPKNPLSKAEASVLAIRLMDYMREDLYTDFVDGIVNYLE